MDRIDHSTALERRFTEGDPLTGLPATVVTADWLNAVQEEILAVITAASLTPDPDDLTQLHEAIAALIAAAPLPSHTHLVAAITDLLTDPHAWAKAQRYTPQALASSSGAVAWDVQAAPVAVLTLTEDVTDITVTNAQAGASYELTLIQDGSGGWEVAWPAAWLWPGGSAPEVTADAGAEDVINLSARTQGGGVVLRAVASQDCKAVS